MALSMVAIFLWVHQWLIRIGNMSTTHVSVHGEKPEVHIEFQWGLAHGRAWVHHGARMEGH